MLLKEVLLLMLFFIMTIVLKSKEKSLWNINYKKALELGFKNLQNTESIFKVNSTIT